MSNEHQSDNRNTAGAGLERDVYDALKLVGWLVPESDGEVQRSELEFEQGPVELPELLKDIRAVFDRPTASGGAILRLEQFAADNETVESLGRAARSGGAISAEIEERMRRDRDSAEHDMEDAKDGQDNQENS